MENEIAPSAPTSTTVTPAQTDVMALVKEMQEKGLEKDEIIEALQEMAKEGKITDADVLKAQEYLAGSMKQEQEKAEQTFGMKFI